MGSAGSSSAGPGAGLARQMQMMAVLFQFFSSSSSMQFSMPAQPAAKRVKALKDAAAERRM